MYETQCILFLRFARVCSLPVCVCVCVRLCCFFLLLILLIMPEIKDWQWLLLLYPICENYVIFGNLYRFVQHAARRIATSMSANSVTFVRQWAQGRTKEMTERVLYRRGAAGSDPGICVKGAYLPISPLLIPFPLLPFPFPSLSPNLPLPSLTFLSP